MRVGLVSTYELGRQPVHLASPAASLRQAGHTVRTLDLAVEPWNDGLFDWAQALAFSVPMHTALRLATRAAERVRRRRAEVPIAAYGLYAEVAGSDGPFSRAIAGEYEEELVKWVASAQEGRASIGTTTSRRRSRLLRPDRADLPGLERYARLEDGSKRALVGSVEATRGCKHRCRHCPLPTVYDGRFRVVASETVLADIERLVRAGAEHITFGDADFFNGPRHSVRIVEEMNRRWPHLTYDATIKVEHLNRHRQELPILARTGCRFVVSAFETLNERILEILDKGHTARDAALVVHAARRAGLEIRPTWLPFTPWTSIRDVADIFDFIVRHELIDWTDPVQLSIRLLVPARSLLAEQPEFMTYRSDYDRTLASYRWTAADPRVDHLATELARIAEEGVERPARRTFIHMWKAVLEAAGDDPEMARSIPHGATFARPRLTEPWFC